MRRVRAAVIGLGAGRRHAAAYARHPACDLAALCDLDPEKLAAAETEYPGVAVTRDAARVLEDPDIDLVSIATFDDRHCEQVLAALERGKHVFVEKPMCLRAEEATRIRAALNQRPDLHLSSNLILRRSPRFRQLKDRLDRGELGALYYVEGDYQYGRLHKLVEGWRGEIPYYSVVCGGALHLIDLLLWLTGDTVRAVSAFGNRIATEGTPFTHNDLVAALLRFDSGMVGKVSANFACVHPHFHALTLFGTKATFVNGLDGARLFTSRESDVPAASFGGDYPGYDRTDLAADFVDALVNGREPAVTADEVFASLSVCFAIERAVREGGVVEVQYL